MTAAWVLIWKWRDEVEVLGVLIDGTKAEALEWARAKAEDATVTWERATREGYAFHGWRDGAAEFHVLHLQADSAWALKL